jgi:hypothetical protein
MEADILTHLQADTTAAAHFARIALADSVTAAEQPAYPVALVMDLAERGTDSPSQRGARQLITREVGVQIASQRANASADASALDAALIGWTPPGALVHLSFARAQLQQLSAEHALWLRVYAAEFTVIRER